ncbi:cysteine ABC transporter substrate-binding protein [Lysinibacillus endophyticus]|uniref:ABC transporter substrate-binding protein n=1 Tax=Ureibacillus endophyticus TaxID=1978490 RepID=A0A494YXT5_9BACL|nr:cysteine ABC transporter substrate-binding protein [Lysinibacillus endophyticus]MCP1143199.1 cysteine ABC transporter substrate-binding protein [Lysinibacillus endophyticus]RKQ14977.1 ABC transporter substrate-binding protein [Lysinibacillus endophyticus]
MKKFLVLLLAALTAVILAACGGSDSEEKAETSSEATSAIDAIKERGTLRVAVFSDKPPFGYVDANGENQGYDVVLAKRLAKDLLGDESKVEYVLTEAQARVDLLKSDKVDVVLANFTVTPERQEQVDFANPYMKVAIGVVSPNSASIESVDQLKGKKLIVTKGTTAETYFMKNHPEIELVKYDQNTESFEALKDRRGDAMAQDNALLFGWANENPDFSVALSSLGDLDYIAPAVKKGNTELLEWLNTELEALGQEQFFHKAYDETLKPSFGENISADDVVVEGKAE